MRIWTKWSAGPANPAAFLAMCLSLSMTATGATELTGQSHVVIDDERACGECSLTVTRRLTLGEREGEGRVGQTILVTGDRRGRYLVAHGDGGSRATRVWVFDKDGGYLRTVGTEGEGPGEYRGVSLLRVTDGDSLEIYDAGLRRRTLLSPEYALVRTQPLDQAYAATRTVVLPDGRAVINRHIQTTESIGYPLQLMNASGEWLRSFGATQPDFRHDEARRMIRVLIPGQDGASVWSIGRTDYRLELWHVADGLQRAIVRSADWFPTWSMPEPYGPDFAGPLPEVRNARRDEAGYLWVLIDVASPRWRDAYTRDTLGRWVLDPQGAYVSRIEVIDPLHGTLKASETMERRLLGFLPDGAAFGYREDALGYPFIDIWNLSIDPPSPEPRREG